MEEKRLKKMEEKLSRMRLELQSEKEKHQLEKAKNKILGTRLKSMEEKLYHSKQKHVLLKKELKQKLNLYRGSKDSPERRARIMRDSNKFLDKIVIKKK